MGTLTYSAMMIALFIIAAFVFGYFETPVVSLKKGLDRLDQGMKNLSNKIVLPLPKKTNDPLTIGLSEQGDSKSSKDLKIFVHEY